MTKIAEFQGQTTANIENMQKDISTIKQDINSIRKWLVIMTIVTAVAFVERLPQLITSVMAGF